MNLFTIKGRQGPGPYPAPRPYGTVRPTITLKSNGKVRLHKESVRPWPTNG